MARTWIVVGDATSHGGTVVSGSPFTDIDGKPVARVGDKVSCPKCGPTTIANGEPTIDIDGKPVARHGDKTACGATLIAGQQIRVSVDGGGGGRGGGSGGGGAASSAAIAAATAAAGALLKKAFNEQFRAVDAGSGAPVAGLPYRIVLEDGAVLEGVTDEDGKTMRVATQNPQKLELHWGVVAAEANEDSHADMEDGC